MNFPPSHYPVRNYRRDIDGLRAIAVLAVFFFHLFPPLLPGGFLGVDVFFVISGYLITGIILRENQEGIFSFRHFYARRIKRIFPALFVLLILSSLIAVFLLVPETYKNFMISARYASAQCANFFFARKVGYFEGNPLSQPLLHTWSLGVEEQFYLFWPLLIFACFWWGNRQKKKTGSGSVDELAEQSPGTGMRTVFPVFLLLALGSFTLCFVLADLARQKAFYSFYTRAWEFCLGGCVSLPILPRTRSKVVQTLLGGTGLLLLGGSFLWVGNEFLGRSFLQFGALLPCLGAALVIYAESQFSLGNRLLATPLPVAVGKISYSLYLYHWPVIIFYKIFTNNHELSWLAVGGIVVVSFLCAIVSTIFIEQPVRKMKSGDSLVLGTAIMIILLFCGLFFFLKRYEHASWRGGPYPSEINSPLPQIPNSCVPQGTGSFVFYECKVSGQETAPAIALVGDSHAPHFLSALVSWASHNGYDVLFLGVAGCPMLLGEVKIESVVIEEIESLCTQALPFFASEIVANPRVTTILIAQRFDLYYTGKGFLATERHLFFKDQNGKRIENYTGYYRERFVDTLQQIRAAGKEPVIMKQAPLFNAVSSCAWEPRLKKIFSQARDCAYDRQFIEKWQGESSAFLNEIAAQEHIAVFDPSLSMPEPLHNNINMYIDIDHLNEYGCQFLLPSFTEAMDRLMAGRKENTNDQAPPNR